MSTHNVLLYRIVQTRILGYLLLVHDISYSAKEILSTFRRTRFLHLVYEIWRRYVPPKRKKTYTNCTSVHHVFHSRVSDSFPRYYTYDFLVKNLVVGQAFLRVRQISPITDIPPYVLYSYSSICHRRHVHLITDNITQ